VGAVRTKEKNHGSEEIDQETEEGQASEEHEVTHLDEEMVND
jgi:hypothetical protein